VLREIRGSDRTRHLPVIILTTSSEEHDITQCYDLGANSYIRKPVDFTQFAETIQSLSMYWLEMNVPPPAKM
jgi:two-component system response regulator